METPAKTKAFFTSFATNREVCSSIFKPDHMVFKNAFVILNIYTEAKFYRGQGHLYKIYCKEHEILTQTEQNFSSDGIHNAHELECQDELPAPIQSILHVQKYLVQFKSTVKYINTIILMYFNLFCN